MTCPNFPNDNQPQRRGWRRATVWGGGAAAGRHFTPWCRPALWQGCTGRGAEPLSYRRCQPPRARQRSCTAWTWRRRALCVLDRVEGYRERPSPAGGLGYASGSVGWGWSSENLSFLVGGGSTEVYLLMEPYVLSYGSTLITRIRNNPASAHYAIMIQRSIAQAYTAISRGDFEDECKLLYC